MSGGDASLTVVLSGGESSLTAGHSKASERQKHPDPGARGGIRTGDYVSCTNGVSLRAQVRDSRVGISG